MAITNQQKIVDAIYSYIKDSIGTNVGNRIYELQAKDNTDLPCCTYQIITDTTENMLNCSVEEVVLQVRIAGWQKNGSKAVRTISDTLYSDLHRGQITIDDSNVSNTVDGTEQGVITVADNVIEIRQEYNIQIV